MPKIELRTSAKIFFSSVSENLKTFPCSSISRRRDVGGGAMGGAMGGDEGGGFTGDGCIGGLGGMDGEVI
jgi:hypothetical protein